MSADPLILVKWVDSASSDGGWEWSDDWKHDPVIIHSVGWEVKRTKSAITIMPHLSEIKDNGLRQGRGGVVIPLKSIQQIHSLNAK